jgi:hypothetical protein
MADIQNIVFAPLKLLFVRNLITATEYQHACFVNKNEFTCLYCKQK